MLAHHRIDGGPHRGGYDDIVAFFKHATPNNASLVIAGDIDIERTRALVEKWFGDVPRGPLTAASGTAWS